MDLPLGVAVATLAAISFGTADFCGAVVSRRVSALSAALSVQIISLIGLTILLIATAHDITPFAMAIGLLAGIGVGLGLLALYQAMAVGAIGVVAVLTGVVASALTLGFDLLVTGQAPSVPQLGGIAFAFGGAALSARLGKVTVAVVALAIVAGTAFGSSFIGFYFAAGESVVGVLLAARISAIVVLGSIWALRPNRQIPVHPMIAGAGALDTAANALMLLAVTLMPVSLATAISSTTPPIVAMLLARLFIGEALPRLAYPSVVLACVGIGLMFIG